MHDKASFRGQDGQGEDNRMKMRRIKHSVTVQINGGSYMDDNKT